jgi:tetraacyldisaccharide 4'-kinase
MREFLYNLATDKSGGFFPGILKIFLFLLSLIYGLIIRTLTWFYSFRLRRLDCKVISVGNITLGGTGKTVLVEYIARFLKGQGCRVAILSRGYKRKLITYDLPCLPAGRPLTAYDKLGDEPCMLQSKLQDVPVIVDKNRIRGAKNAINNHSVDTVILDDGFQQWRIKKDLNIAVIDATNPFGNQELLPRGILREPLSSLKRADLFVLTKADFNPDTQGIADFLTQLNPQAQIIEAVHQPISLYPLGSNDKALSIDGLKNKNVTLFSGIGDPDSFENLITKLGANISLSFRFPDHHNYSQANLENIIQESRKRNINTIITTEKDAVRIVNLRLTTYDLQLILALRIELKITKNEEGLHSRLLKLYSF